MNKISLIIVSILFCISACAPIPQSYEPIIDHGGNFDSARYWQDLRECQAYAKRISPANQATGEALAGAAFGAALGAILGSGSGIAGRYAGIGAGMGGLTGAARGAGNAIGKQKIIIQNCMRGRNYKVLD